MDRLVPDGTWSGNVYDFFRRVYQKLTVDLKVPFLLRDGQRVEDTPVHEALREALVNTLIHADFSGRMSVLVVKRPDMFGFRNPGLMRVSPELAVQGGHSDCRNRRLQHMFRLVGYGDQAGSGLPKIFSNWSGQHWKRPVLRELREPEQTAMELHMASLLPPDVLALLEKRLGERFKALSHMERLALVVAATDGLLNHARLREMSTEHPVDITRMLSRLVRAGLLVSEGVGRGTVYFLPWQVSSSCQPGIFDDQRPLSVGALTPELDALTPELDTLTPELGALTPELDAPEPVTPVLVVSDVAQLAASDLARLQALAQPCRERKRSTPAQVREVVIALCTGQYLGLKVLAALLGRRDQEGADLRKRILNPLVAEGRMLRAFARPNDPRQAYMTALPEKAAHAQRST